MSNFSTKIYDTFMEPFERKGIRETRKKHCARAYGNVLEVGPGTGVNIKYYDMNSISKLSFVDLKFNVDFINKIKENSKMFIFNNSVEDLPFESNSFDTIIITLVFCSVENPLKGLSEIRRVLKENGKIYFIEHVQSDKDSLKPILNFMTPLWKKVANGCHLNRDTLKTFKEADFEIVYYNRFLNGVFIEGEAIKNIIL
ncbi:class I SAM-dependent methyltransferase [Helicovermis profundi]|uniref:Class I SAM-dependent methyltransferase n=1 Tax=Helicovermis profundi TaxID=3065157 RepID=A0AAU9EQE1_9FIRM|nr:class I SAM-dependent methyltransferase [Clostridia bacterium S502]